LARQIRIQLDVKDYSFGYFTLILSLRYLVKCWSRSLAVYNNKFILDSACIGSENHQNHKMTKNLQAI